MFINTNGFLLKWLHLFIETYLSPRSGCDEKITEKDELLNNLSSWHEYLSKDSQRRKEEDVAKKEAESCADICVREAALSRIGKYM